MRRMTAPAWLTALGIPEGCIEYKAAAEQKGCKFSILHKFGDHIWRVKVDQCWFADTDGKRVDYLFWGQSATTGRRIVVLVELKGSDFGGALEQIRCTLERLCKKAVEKGIHTGRYKESPGHDQHDSGGVQAYVVLTKGKGVPLRQRELEQLRNRYGIIVRTGEKHLEINLESDRNLKS